MPQDHGAGESKPATIYDVARFAGVSHQTVSRVLLGYEGIRPATRERVEEALRALDYRRNITARNLRLGRTGMVSLAIPSLNQPYFAELAQAVILAARTEGLTVLVETTEGDRDRELSLLTGTRGNLVDGVMFAPSALSAEDLAAVRIDFPLVLLGDRVFSSEHDHVVAANAEGAQAATEHLISIGRRRIAAIGVEPPGNSGAARLRLEGYRAALAAAGIDDDPSLMLDGGGWLKDDGVRAIARALDAGLSFDAVFGFNDALALGAMRGLFSAGLTIPGDVAVVGFDDTQDARYSTPSLSSVAPGLLEIARTAVSLVERRIQSGSVSAQEVKVGFHLIPRESTGTID